MILTNSWLDLGLIGPCASYYCISFQCTRSNHSKVVRNVVKCKLILGVGIHSKSKDIPLKPLQNRKTFRLRRSETVVTYDRYGSYVAGRAI